MYLMRVSDPVQSSNRMAYPTCGACNACWVLPSDWAMEEGQCEMQGGQQKHAAAQQYK